jgi:hypothetical protein
MPDKFTNAYQHMLSYMLIVTIFLVLPSGFSSSGHDISLLCIIFLRQSVMTSFTGYSKQAGFLFFSVLPKNMARKGIKTATEHNEGLTFV